jgi:hypothetical protein
VGLEGLVSKHRDRTYRRGRIDTEVDAVDVRELIDTELDAACGGVSDLSKCITKAVDDAIS